MTTTNQIESLLEAAKTNGIAKISTCDHYNWDTKLHDDMLILRRKQLPDYSITYNINYGVWDWTIIYCA